MAVAGPMGKAMDAWGGVRIAWVRALAGLMYAGWKVLILLESET
jgi:hypothetical protein